MELKELSTKVNEYVKTREKRLALQRKTDEVKEQEDHLKILLLSILVKNNTSAATGKSHTVTRHLKEKPVASDWAKLYPFIKENDAFDLLQRRLNESAVELRWEEGIIIPGVTKFPVETLSISKVKGT